MHRDVFRRGAFWQTPVRGCCPSTVAHPDETATPPAGRSAGPRRSATTWDDASGNSQSDSRLSSNAPPQKEPAVTDAEHNAEPSHDFDFSGLKALFINCTLKKSPQLSHTRGLIDISKGIMEANGVTTETIRAVDLDIAYGVWPDMTEHGAETDDWPELYAKVQDSDILVLGSAIWLGEKTSVCTKVIERLYGNSSELNEHGQYAYYGKVGGCLITGNEDGAKHCSMNILYSLQHLGYTIPPQADAAWIGEAGPGPSYLDDGSGGPENDFTNRNTTFMTWNLMNVARMLKDEGGLPVHGNQRSLWDAGCRFDFENPEYR
ncbi:MAG: flavodoxin family protein [Acidimicrobiia bacterium]|nr:flavodoxin family protein [Acidimicrobiia bacterium]